MIAVLTLLKDQLQTNASLVAMVGDSCYAIVGPQAEEVGKLFVVYSTSESEQLTKDGVIDYTVRVHCSAETVDVLMQLMQVVKQAMSEVEHYPDYLGSSEIAMSQDQHYTIDLNYNITL